MPSSQYPFGSSLGQPCHKKATKSAALEQLAAPVNSNAKLPGLGLTQSRIKTPGLAGETLAVRDKGPETVTEQGQAISGKDRGTIQKRRKSLKLTPNGRRK